MHSSSRVGYRDYGFHSVEHSHMHRHFMPHVLAMSSPMQRGMRVLDVGCGNGATASEFLQRGCSVVGIDLSETGIEIARKNYPAARFEVLDADSNLLQNLQEPPFDLVVSTEVVEHLYAPRSFVKGCYGALRPGGRFVCTTPYHGYLKNLFLALLDKWDQHANPLWDGGHIKLWSRRTLSTLLTEAGFVKLRFRGAGRAPYLWMTMIMGAEKAVGVVDDS